MPSPGVVLALLDSTAPAANLYEAIRTRLMINPLLAEIDNCYLVTVQPAAPVPYIVFNPLGTKPVDNSGGVGYWETERIQFTAVCTSATEAIAIGRIAYQTFTFKPSNPPLVFSDGYDMARTPGRTWLMSMKAQGPGANLIWYLHFECEFLVGRAK